MGQLIRVDMQLGRIMQLSHQQHPMMPRRRTTQQLQPYIDQVAGVAPSTNATWTIMVYIDGDNLASAAVDDLNEMEGVILPEM